VIEMISGEDDVGKWSERVERVTGEVERDAGSIRKSGA
jgi:hypothetical protein